MHGLTEGCPDQRERPFVKLLPGPLPAVPTPLFLDLQQADL
ncbi:hypothetical protein [Sphingomonas yabuuchiae]|nr:hypothetical protein [Sphingomonas yabuuchiae]